MGEIFVDVSPNDGRKYRLVTLGNDLRALLISDRDDHQDDEDMAEDEDSENSDDMDTDDEQDEDSHPLRPQAPMQASAALCVHAGAFLDPEDLPGLAHYLEHMLFMGCKKFEGANDWDKRVKDSGNGSSNARTDFDYTVFQFDIQSTQFEEALEHFAEFFISPLFKEENMASELEIIDREFNEVRLIDLNRIESLIALTAKKDHPIRKFAWGNHQSLKVDPDKLKINVRERIKSFFAEHYVAQHMTLCVMSNETLETLESWVIKYFEKIRKSNSIVPDYTNLGNPFETSDFTKIIKVIPVRNVRQLQLTWALPSLCPLYRSRPDVYIAFILGHEGKGSLLSALGRRGYVVSLQAGVRDGISSDQEHNKTCTCFTIFISLTQLGLENIDECLQMMRDNGPQQQIWHEANFIEIAEFRYMEPEMTNFPTLMAQNLFKYHPSDVVTAHYIQQLEYSAKNINWLLGLMKADKMNMIILSQHFDDGSSTQFLEEKWFKTKYAVEDIPKKWTQKWLGAQSNSEIRYPDSNNYIPIDFSIKKLPNNQGPKLEEPLCVFDCAELWYYMNDIAIPKAYASFYLKSVHVASSPSTRAMNDLYAKLLNVHLTEMCYPAGQAGLHADVYALDYGLAVRISGFNNKLPVFFSDIINEIRDCVVSEEIFDSVKEELNDSYLNLSACPQRLNREFCQAALRKGYWTPIDRREALGELTARKMKAFLSNYYNGMFVEGLVQGNLFPGQAKEMLQFLQQTLDIRCPDDDYLGMGYVTELPCGNTLFCVHNMNPCDDQTVVQNYYQFEGVATSRELLLNEIFLVYMDEPCFYYLRTKHKLAYSPTAATRNLHNVIGFAISVITSASKFTAKKVDDYIESFLVDFNNQVQSMAQDTFDKFIQGQKDSRTLEESILKEEVDRHWREIVKHTYKFETQEDEREILDEITLETFKQWSRAHLLPSAYRRKLSIQVVGHSCAESGAKCTGFDDTIKLCVVDEATRKSYNVLDNLTEFSSVSCRRYAVNLFTDSANNGTQSPVYFSD